MMGVIPSLSHCFTFHIISFTLSHCCYHIEYVLETTNGGPTTVTGNCYSQVVRDFVISELRNRQCQLEEIWYQRTKVLSGWKHCTHVQPHYINTEGILPRSHHFAFWWYLLAAKITRLSCPKFRLWDYLKYKVFANRVESVEKLKARIREEIATITPEVIGVLWSFWGRLAPSMYCY